MTPFSSKQRQNRSPRGDWHRPGELIDDMRFRFVTEGMKDGSRDVVGPQRIVFRIRPAWVGAAVDLAATDPAACHQYGLTWRPVVAAGVFVDLGRAAELGDEADERRFEKRARNEQRNRAAKAAAMKRCGLAAAQDDGIALAQTLHATDRKGSLALQDDPTKSSFLSPPSFISGGGGLCSTAADYLTFCRTLINGGELGGVRLIGPKTLALMTSNHLPGGRDLPAMSRSLFSEATYNGIGFGLGFQVTMNPTETLIPGSVGEYAWGGLATTSFWIDPAEELIAVFMTQVIPSSAYPIRRELRTMVYAAITDSNL